MLKKMILYISNFVSKWYNHFRIGSDIMNNGVDILDVAKTLIHLFNNDNKLITQLKLQKLLYFIEAYYMANFDHDRLYHEEFNAWTYGPLCQAAYYNYKYYGSSPIYDDGGSIPELDEEVISSIKSVYRIFGDLSTASLIKLTHMQNSPWFNTPKNCNAIISKHETRVWFEEKFMQHETR